MTTEEDIELPVPDHEEAFDDTEQVIEVIEEEDSLDEPEEAVKLNDEEFDTDVPNEALDSDEDGDELPPDQGDDMQGDWDLSLDRYLRINSLLDVTTDEAESAAMARGAAPRGVRRDKNLNAKDRTRARRIAVRAAILGLHHAPNIHYTQGGSRWQGIADTRYSSKQQYPNYADCSAFATWCLWNGLYVPFREHDVVNGAGWKAGYTGTMLSHGVPVRNLKYVRWGDCVLYGAPGSSGRHVAIVVSVGKPRGSRVMVVSHGSEGGPYHLPYNYRGDIQSVRRYTHYKVV